MGVLASVKEESTHAYESALFLYIYDPAKWASVASMTPDALVPAQAVTGSNAE
jgi:hypothetical protein